MQLGCGRSWAFLRHHAGCELYGLGDARIAAAAAQMAVHGLANFAVARLSVAGEQLGALDDHAVVTVAALRRLLVDQGPLQRMKRRRAREIALAGVERREPLERRHRLSFDRPDRRDAGTDFDAVEQHRA